MSCVGPSDMHGAPCITVHATSAARQCMPCQRRERLCAAERLTTTTVVRRSCHTHENCMHAEQIIIIFYIYNFIFCSLYLLLFLIVLYRTIVAVYIDNIFLYNYLWQMHQIIHLSPVVCFSPARGKTVQKNRKVSGVKELFSEFMFFQVLPQ